MSENITNGEDNNFNNSSSQQMPDIDELQALIKQKMAEDEDSDDYEETDHFSEAGFGEDLENEFYDIAPSEKKFVVPIESENILFFDSLSVEERASLVNTLISRHREEIKYTPDELKTKKFIRHALVVLITVAVGFPLIFYLTNASIEATLNSYRQIQGNFEKLYQQKGGVKRKDLTKIQNLQY